jgi:polar amino acid transport system substrate-binding protein
MDWQARFAYYFVRKNMKKRLAIAAAAVVLGSTFTPAQAALTGTVNKGVLTIATDNPAYSPWFDSNKPANGKGFESAVAYAVAKQLGYAPSQVKWVTATFDSVIQPGKKNYDFDINQVSITDERKKAVDFSSGYYDVAQSIVSIKGNSIVGAKTLAALANAKFGAAVGTTSLDAINNSIKPKNKASVYNTNDLAVAALSAKQIDGIVVDLPTAFYLTATVKDAVLVGQLPTSGKAEQFGLVLTKGSKLTAQVSKAVDALRKNGTLKALADKWLANTAGAPVLK